MRSIIHKAPPSQSKGGVVLFGMCCVTVLSARMAARKHIGTGSRKRVCHEWYWMTNPPTAGPVMRPMAVATPMRPRELPSLSAPKAVLIIAGPLAMSMAAPNAWPKRQRMRRFKLGALEQSKEPMPKIKRPAVYRLPRPKRVAICPQNSMVTDVVRRYISTTHSV